MRYLQKTSRTRKANLDIKDKKILALISANSRMPLTQLSKKIALSRDAINYRIKNYEKNGIIQGYRTIVDMSKFGYHSTHLFIKLNNPSKEIETKIINKLTKYPFIRAILKFSGNYDLEIAFIAKDIKNLDEILTQIIIDCSGAIQDYELLTISKTFAAETFPPNFSEYKLKREIKKGATKKIDRKDIEILNIISEEATLPLHEIAGKVKLSADAVAYRIKNMVNSGTILKFVPVINYTSLNYNLYTILLNVNGLDEEKEKVLKNFLSTDKNTLWAVKTIGRFNVLMKTSKKQLSNFEASSQNRSTITKH